MYTHLDLEKFPRLDSGLAKRQLIRVLQNAHAGELAAAFAYTGHGYSFFIRNKEEKTEVLKIRDEELHHRARLKEMLNDIGASPRFLREALMACIGLVIGTLCLFGGWFIPMYGAGKLESGNIFEYEVAARLAWMADKKEWVEEFIEFGELEWDHELYFRKKVQTHFLHRHIPFWPFPKEKEKIKDDFLLWSQKP